ncbi:MAG TPA: AMP-binding protein, partial [Rhizobiaceae bacterium]|nr:AMP-binding protein [Rhizobiaceae bacterium]
MQGLMMDRALVIPSIIEHAARYHGDTEVVSVNTLGGQHRTNYAQIRARALRMASALQKRGMRKSDRIATIAWNNYRHLELYYAISGSGYVLHTINPRLFAEQLVYIVNHAEDRIIFFDATFLPLVEGLREHLPNVEAFVLMEAADPALAQKHPWLTFYEDLLSEGDNGHEWP